ncbi:MAG TPA: hypothetical protein VFH89_13475 [Sphingomicrobium sp.]|nr:hypothetical protein [Sphingomicrobium sp.]
MAYSVPIQFEDRDVASFDPETGEIAYSPQWLESGDSFPISRGPMLEIFVDAIRGLAT